ncbi:DUF2605 domain-containing protein [Waterburya agarophytonicola K14]|uniref:DUF2605 domain-containing protein n=1 Tax=Waterburya agarophytonicola KI4 TaxID=2874699 RepID=A0A964BQN0_9CYAN|nr:DUF2605 domain-containing protein [Waterburya agarophytonicola]MCC0177036.1 DUF2605 domain-containing protein [Waterburya agarophytonicola KI4]
MSTEQPTEKELLKTVLEPLLEDFQYWFERSRNLLESEQMSFFSHQEQAQLLERIIRCQKEVQTSQMLFKATDGSAGIDSKMLLPWHQLVAECWNVAQKWRETKNQSDRILPES